MSESYCHLYRELLELVEAQRKSLLEGRLDIVFKLHERRQKIIDKIQNFDSNLTSDNHTHPLNGKNVRLGEDFSQEIQLTIGKILSLDNEMRTIIQTELSSLAESLGTVQKLRAFCHNAAYTQAGENLSISI